MPRPRRKASINEKIAAAIAELEDGVEDAKKTAAEAEFTSPAVLASKVADIKKRWMDTPPLFEGDGELMEKLRESYSRAFVLMMDSFEKILEQLHAQIANPPADWNITNYMSLFQTLGSQIANFRTGQQHKPSEDKPTRLALPDTEEELDRRLAEAEAERARRAKPVKEEE